MKRLVRLVGQRAFRTALLALLAPAGQALAQTSFYASPSGTKTASGTLGQPWDITKACTSSVLGTGDTVWMRGGVYPTSANFGSNPYRFVMSMRRGGVTYKAYPGERPIIRGATSFVDGNGDQVSTIQLSANNITLDGLEIRWGSKYGITYFSRINGTVIRNCVFDSCPAPADGGDNEATISTPMDTYYADGWLIEDNEFRNPRGRGAVHMYGMDRTIIRRNRFVNIGTPYGAIFLKTGSLGNRDNEWYDNVIHSTGADIVMGTHCNATVTNLRVHNNVVYGSGGIVFQFSYPACFQSAMNFDSIFVYNNTFDMSGFNSNGSGLVNGHGSLPPNEDVDNFFMFNNLFYLASNNNAIKQVGSANDFSWAPFGDTWYSDYNAFVLRSATDRIYTWETSGSNTAYWTLSQWQTQGPTLNATYTADPHSQTTTNTANFFIDQAARNYRIHTSNAMFTFLMSGGRGGSWPSYIGAFGSSQPCLDAGPDSLLFSVLTGEPNPQTVLPLAVNNGCSGTNLSWSATESASWLSISPGSGVTPGSLTATVTPSGLASGTYRDTIRITSAGASNSPLKVPVILRILVPDTDPPTISAVAATDLGGCSAVIRWHTNEAATSLVEYGTTASYGLQVSVSGGDTAHAVPLAGLVSSTTYFYRVSSADTAGNARTSGGSSFNTTADNCNLALGIQPSVSGSYSGYDPVTITDGIVDPRGLEATTWASDDAATGSDWIEIDFGSPRSVDNVTIHWAYNTFQSLWMISRQYRVEYWNGSQFVTAATENNPTDTITGTRFAPVTTQRVRIFQPQAGGPASYPGILWVSEVEMFVDSIPPAAVVDVR